MRGSSRFHLSTRRSARGWAILVALVVSCARDDSPTSPDLKAGGAAPLKAAPAAVEFVVPPSTPATVTATVQYVGLITARSSDNGCATVSPLNVPATKPPGSSVYVAVFTVSPVAVGTCTVTVTDKKGNRAVVQVSVTAKGPLDRIAFASYGTTRRGLFLMQGDGSAVTPITDHGFAPALSPDGSKVAYECPDPNDPSRPVICVANIDGSDEWRVTTGLVDRVPRWTPDGSKIVFWSHRSGHHVWIVDADGQHQTDLTAVADPFGGAGLPVVSPDGSRIAYASGDADGLGIWAMQLDGTAPTRLVNTGTLAPEHISWSPDGQSFLFSTFTDFAIHRVNADGTGLTKLTIGTEFEDHPAWSPDGSRYVFVRAGDLFSRALDGSDEVRLTDDPADDFEPDWR